MQSKSALKAFGTLGGLVAEAGSYAIDIVGIGPCGSTASHTCELSAMLPCVCPCAVVGQVAKGIIGIRPTAIVGHPILK